MTTQFNRIALVAMIILQSCQTAAVAQSSHISDSRAINAIIGEAEGESYEGKVGIAYAIINRGSLKGVFGEKSPRVIHRLYSQATYEEVKAAWEFAKANPEDDNTNGATGWGNKTDTKIFSQKQWFKKCHYTARIGNQFFYACKE